MEPASGSSEDGATVVIFVVVLAEPIEALLSIPEAPAAGVVVIMSAEDGATLIAAVSVELGVTAAASEDEGVVIAVEETLEVGGRAFKVAEEPFVTFADD